MEAVETKRATALKTYLLNLTSRRAVILFLVAFGCGSASMWLEFLVPWLPAFIVLVYGCLLLYAAKVLLVSHSEMTNNSPYFLGFLLFLVSLFTAFGKLGTKAESGQVDFLVAQLGAALLTTIVGLPLRQLLFAYAPAQQEQDTFFRTLENELRRSATQFQKSQTELVELLQGFIVTRESLFLQEEVASRRYVENLEKAVAVFDGALDGYPAHISSALSKCGTSVTKMKNKLDQLSASSESLDGVAFTRALERLEALGTSTSEVIEKLERLKESTSSLSQAADELPAHVRAALSIAKTASEQVGADIAAKVTGIKADLDAIDAILSEFVTITRERITQPQP